MQSRKYGTKLRATTHYRQIAAFHRSVDNQRNGVETQAKALMTSVIRPDTLYFGTL